MRSGRRSAVATSPSQSPASWSRRPARRSGRSARRPPGRWSRSPRACRAARRRRRRRRRSCSSIASTGSASSASRSGIVAEDLDLDRLGVALEIAEHVLQQLHELDVDERRRLVEAFAQVADDRLGRSLARATRLQADEDVARVLRGREQAQLGSGAARVGGDLGRLLRRPARSPEPGGRSRRARCRPASRSRRRTRPRPRREGSRCRPGMASSDGPAASRTATARRPAAGGAPSEQPAVDAIEPAVRPRRTAMVAAPPTAPITGTRLIDQTPATAAPRPTGSATARGRTVPARRTAGRAARTPPPWSASS